MKSLFGKIIRATVAAEEWIITIIEIVVPVMIFASVIMRHLLYRNFDGLTELVGILVSWLYFSGSAVVTYNNTHINASVLDNLFKKKRSFAIVQMIRQIISVVFYTIIFKLAMDNVVWMLQTGPETAMLRLPAVLLQIPIAICFFLSVVYTLIHIVKFYQEAKNAGKDELRELSSVEEGGA